MLDPADLWDATVAVRAVACPFCVGVPGTCCRCQGCRRVPYRDDLLTQAWDVPGCRCDACRAARRQEAGLGPEPAPAPPPPPPLIRRCAYCGARDATVEAHDAIGMHASCAVTWDARKGRSS